MIFPDFLILGDLRDFEDEHETRYFTSKISEISIIGKIRKNHNNQFNPEKDKIRKIIIISLILKKTSLITVKKNPGAESTGTK